MHSGFSPGATQAGLVCGATAISPSVWTRPIRNKLVIFSCVISPLLPGSRGWSEDEPARAV
jgi:hypothetical protein